jgi:transaldolase/glucose-6-phosphate isomerase
VDIDAQTIAGRNQLETLVEALSIGTILHELTGRRGLPALHAGRNHALPALFFKSRAKPLNASQEALVTGALDADSDWQLPDPLQATFPAALRAWDIVRGSARLWARDASLWTGGDEARWLGWLDIAPQQSRRLDELRSFAQRVRAGDFADAVLLGMGGSSLGPEVISTIFASPPGHPRLHVLDSTDPQQVGAVAERVAAQRALYFVSSKSGSTLEPHILMERFWHDAEAATGGRAGERFIAVTDPGSKLEQLARERGFRAVFHGVPEIGGRYSVLSDFGLAPAAACGVEIAPLLERALAMTLACGAGVAAADNPAVRLGILLGEAARQGRDKLTLVASPPLWDLGAWLEQLIAESTGKQGKAIIPVDGERLAPPDRYGEDRVFVHLRLDGETEPVQEAALQALARAGHPVVTLHLRDRPDLGAEFVRWEIASAVAGSLLGIHPFDQPDVEASKIETRKLTDAYERTGELPREAPLIEDRGIRAYADPRNAAELMSAGQSPPLSLPSFLASHLGRIHRGDYFAILAYVERCSRHREPLQTLRHRVRDGKRVATCLGFGPRFLHSTGQAYKGGPNTGVFLQITCDDARDLEVPGKRYTFGVVKAAQARGDFQVLAERGRRALRVHLGSDVAAGLAALEEAVAEALS